jgi:hypothetical protein
VHRRQAVALLHIRDESRQPDIITAELLQSRLDLLVPRADEHQLRRFSARAAAMPGGGDARLSA